MAVYLYTNTVVAAYIRPTASIISDFMGYSSHVAVVRIGNFTIELLSRFVCDVLLQRKTRGKVQM